MNYGWKPKDCGGIFLMSFKELSESTIWKEAQTEKKIHCYKLAICWISRHKKTFKSLGVVRKLWIYVIWGKTRDSPNGDKISVRRPLPIWLSRNWVYCKNKHLKSTVIRTYKLSKSGLYFTCKKHIYQITESLTGK